MANYADDCSPYESSVSIEYVIFKLENDARLLMEWYTNNYLSPNPDKWHLQLSDMDFLSLLGRGLSVTAVTKKS